MLCVCLSRSCSLYCDEKAGTLWSVAGSSVKRNHTGDILMMSLFSRLFNLKQCLEVLKPINLCAETIDNIIRINFEDKGITLTFSPDDNSNLLAYYDDGRKRDLSNDVPFVLAVQQLVKLEDAYRHRINWVPHTRTIKVKLDSGLSLEYDSISDKVNSYYGKELWETFIGNDILEFLVMKIYFAQEALKKGKAYSPIIDREKGGGQSADINGTCKIIYHPKEIIEFYMCNNDGSKVSLVGYDTLRATLKYLNNLENKLMHRL